LEYFDSENLAASSVLYRQLEKFDWYYMPHKWEHDAAIQDLRKSDRVLEVGCGRGDFVERLRKDEQIEASGIDLNTFAVTEAQRLGRPVRCMSLEDIVEHERSEYDALCCFQVLEHVSAPDKFMDSLIELLQPGGRLLLGVPNSAGFIGLDPNGLLNQPPHHVSRWSPHVLQKLAKYFPVVLRKIQYEPLAAYHLDYYFHLQRNRLSHTHFLNGLVNHAVDRLLLPLARRTGWYRYLRGHTIYAAFEKRSV
jgi:2-polyprenyl-3-methyl-5-hydroxy-6-metoxy-1,4-benzoquinol methylase